MDKVKVIQKLIDLNRFKTYLEIGVFTGENFFQVKASRKIAVDPVFNFSSKQKWTAILKNFSNLFAKYFNCTSDEFFNTSASGLFSDEKAEVVLVDGMHEFAFALRDIENSLKHLSDDGVIVVHDCNPQTLEAACSFKEWKEREYSGWWNGDVWKAIVYLSKYRKDVDVFVADCDHGLGIITKNGKKAAPVPPEAFDEVNKLTYERLNESRESLLNLKSVSFLENFVSVQRANVTIR